MPAIEYADVLKKSFWDKKKGTLDGASALDDALKVLQKKHEAVDWPKLAAGWAKGMDDARRLKAQFDLLDKLYRAKASPLRLEANELAALADKAAKGKDASKPLRDACALISRAALAYGKAIAGGLDELTAEYDKAQGALPAEDEDEEPSSVLIDPKRLLKQLQLCKADPARQVYFALLDDGDQNPVLVVHVRIAGRALLARLIKDTGIKKGAFGLLSLDGSNLKLVVEKKVSGLVKRIRIPIRLCGFKLGKVALVDDKGTVLDEDLDDEDKDKLAEDQASRPVQQKAAGAAGPGLNEALALWSQARERAITELKSVARQIADLKDPESGKAVMQISAVVKQLTAEPRTAQQVGELVRYIDKDDVVLDVSDMAQDIRTPLLKALAQVHRAVSAG